MPREGFLRLDPAFDALVPEDSSIEKLATGFLFTEGPIWMRDGSLVFSDIPANTMYRRTADGTVAVFRKPSGFDGAEWPQGAFVGSNGMTLDARGRLIICEHGNHRVTRLEADGSLTVLVEQYQGKRLNSPNDAVHHSSGALYFTDPPYGLVGQDSDPAKELDFNGVFRLSNGEFRLLYRDLTRPNGLAFTPDEKYLYIANSDPARKIWMRFTVDADGSLSDGEVFFDSTSLAGSGVPDGMKLDVHGNLYCTGPGGILVLTPEGKHLGTIAPPEQPANLHWGEGDAQTLYITARTSLYRIRLNTRGIRP